MISNIKIRNFRSIDQLDIPTSRITGFVGLNDVGKSNILRALNLFFNDETDRGKPLDFDQDFNKHAVTRKKKAKEIIIEITVDLPRSYQKADTSAIWRRVWRSDGERIEGRKRSYPDGGEFGSYSKIPTFLDRIRYHYVPAIKDQQFFANLQGKIYEVIAHVATQSLRKSAKEFEASIEEHIAELVSEVSGLFHFPSGLELPTNLRNIFENLEFKAGNVPLAQRGDGIKVRHVPIILKFLDEKRNSLMNQGGVRHSSIWGFEEPENNIEFSAAFDLAQQFSDFANSNRQIMFTTHSPAFYMLSSDEDSRNTAKIYVVSKKGSHSKAATIDQSDINEEMGLLPLISPFVKEERNKWVEHIEEVKQTVARERKIAKREIPTLFVEGKSDKIALTRIVAVFYPKIARKISINSGESNEYGSASAVVNRVLAWQLLSETSKQREPERCAGIVDRDTRAPINKKHSELCKFIGRKSRNISKLLVLGKPRRLVGLHKAGFILPFDIEAFYPDSIWEIAFQKGWLEKATNVNERVGDKEAIDLLLTGSGNSPLCSLPKEDQLRVVWCWKPGKKVDGAKLVKDMSDHDILNDFEDLANAIKPALKHILPKENFK